MPYGLEFSAQAQLPPIPLPEVFRSVNSWSYTGNPYVSPAGGEMSSAFSSDVPPDVANPDLIIIRPPDRYHIFDVPGGVEYVLVPPAKHTATDPSGMKAMMKFLGFKDEHVHAASAVYNPPPTAQPGAPGRPPGNPAAPGTPGQPSTASPPPGQMPRAPLGQTPPGFPIGGAQYPGPPIAGMSPAAPSGYPAAAPVMGPPPISRF